MKSDDWLLEIKIEPEQLEQYRRLIKLAAGGEGQEGAGGGGEGPSPSGLAMLGLSEDDLRRIAIGALVGILLGSIFGSNRDNILPVVLLSVLGSGGLAYFLPHILASLQETATNAGVQAATKKIEEQLGSAGNWIKSLFGLDTRPLAVREAERIRQGREEGDYPGLIGTLLGRRTSGSEYRTAFKDVFEKGEADLPMHILANDYLTPVPLPTWASGGIGAYTLGRLAWKRELPFGGVGARIGGGIGQILSELRGGGPGTLPTERYAFSRILSDPALKQSYADYLAQMRSRLRSQIASELGGARNAQQIASDLVDDLLRPIESMVGSQGRFSQRSLERFLNWTPSTLHNVPQSARIADILGTASQELRPSAYLGEEAALGARGMLRRFRMHPEVAKAIPGAGLGRFLGRAFAAYALLDFLFHAARAWHAYSRNRVPGYSPEDLEDIVDNAP